MNKYLGWIEKDAGLVSGALGSLGRIGLGGAKKTSSFLSNTLKDAVGTSRMDLINKNKFKGRGTASQLAAESARLKKIPTRMPSSHGNPGTSNFNPNLRANLRAARPLQFAAKPLKVDKAGGMTMNPKYSKDKKAAIEGLRQADKKTLDGRVKLGLISAGGIYAGKKVVNTFGNSNQNNSYNPNQY